MPVVYTHLTPKYYVDETISHNLDGITPLRLYPDEKLKIDEQDSIILTSTLTSLKTIIKIPTKAYVDFLSENHRRTCDLSTVLNDQDNELENNKLTKLDNITFNWNPVLDEENMVM